LILEIFGKKQRKYRQSKSYLFIIQTNKIKDFFPYFSCKYPTLFPIKKGIREKFLYLFSCVLSAKYRFESNREVK